MKSFLQGASSFNQDLSGWCVENIESEPIEMLSEQEMIEQGMIEPITDDWSRRGEGRFGQAQGQGQSRAPAVRAGWTPRSTPRHSVVLAYGRPRRRCQ